MISRGQGLRAPRQGWAVASNRFVGNGWGGIFVLDSRPPGGTLLDANNLERPAAAIPIFLTDAASSALGYPRST